MSNDECPVFSPRKYRDLGKPGSSYDRGNALDLERPLLWLEAIPENAIGIEDRTGQECLGDFVECLGAGGEAQADIGQRVFIEGRVGGKTQGDDALLADGEVAVNTLSIRTDRATAFRAPGEEHTRDVDRAVYEQSHDARPTSPGWPRMPRT